MKTCLLALIVLHLGLAAAAAQPVITNQPQSQTAIVGATVSFSVGATGAPPLSYQWIFRNLGNPLPGATNDTLILPNVQASNDGNYRVTITNAAGSVLSGSARLTVVTPPTITPANPTASLFADVTLLATNVAAGAISSQWLFNGEPIVGAVTNRLVVTNVQKTNAGDYAIVATYAFGSATSQVATLKIVPFNSIYCFGFSWTDTRGIGCGWNLPSYYMSRACNGPMWPEFLSTNLGLAYAESNNYARCGATAADVLNQVAGFAAPPKPQLSLYGLWAGDSDFLRAIPPDGFGFGYLNVTNEVAWNQLIQTIISSNSNAVNRLYTKGARAIVIQNQVDYRGLPGALLAFGTNSVGLSKLSEYIARFNAGFIDAMNAYSQTRPDLRIVSVDMFSKVNDVLGHPDKFDVAETKIDALGDMNLTDKSFAGPGADYVFWDALHPTSKLYKLVASWHREALTHTAPETLDAKRTNGDATIGMRHLLIGRDYTLQTSSDLASWNEVQTFTASAGTNEVTHPLKEGTASVFYRLQWQP
jgi:phospholipase/lecithinase/hemolysin